MVSLPDQDREIHKENYIKSACECAGSRILLFAAKPCDYHCVFVCDVDRLEAFAHCKMGYRLAEMTTAPKTASLELAFL